MAFDRDRSARPLYAAENARPASQIHTYDRQGNRRDPEPARANVRCQSVDAQKHRTRLITTMARLSRSADRKRAFNRESSQLASSRSSESSFFAERSGATPRINGLHREGFRGSYPTVRDRPCTSHNVLRTDTNRRSTSSLPPASPRNATWRQRAQDCEDFQAGNLGFPWAVV